MPGANTARVKHTTGNLKQIKVQTKVYLKRGNLRRSRMGEAQRNPSNGGAPPCNDKTSIMIVTLTKSPGAILNSEAGPKGEGHDCMDTGGRTTQEQLSRSP
jgi:hypothetical protein